MNKKQPDHGGSYYKQRLDSLLARIKEKCPAFNPDEALRICAGEKGGVFEQLEGMKADIPILEAIVEKSHQLSKASRSVRVAIRTLAEKGLEVYKKVREECGTTVDRAKKQLNGAKIFELFRYLDRVGVPDGKELYALTAGILIYTETIPASEFGLPADVKIFELSSERMDKLKEGHLETVLKKWQERMRGWGKREGLSEDEIEKISVRLSPNIRALSYPGSRASLAKAEGVGHKLTRGSILPKAGRTRGAK